MKSIVALVQNLHEWFVKIVSALQPVLLLAVRVYFGVQLAQNGWGKLHHLARVTDYFSSLRLPAPGLTAAFVSTVEFVGGITLAIGLLSRITALAIFVDMLTAYVTADREALTSIISNPGKFCTADEYTFFFAGLLILIFGPGKISLDTFLERWFKKEVGGERHARKN
jgi:putative oxidoreductase